jgi:putative phage-type endonuclease
MKTIDLIQGTPEWHAHRASHFNASDAPAMMGCSAYKTRSQLLHEMHTGITPTVDAATQRRFDEGHRIEALARPLAEDIIGEELYPVTGSEGKLSASFDGLTMMGDVAFEHKTLNAELLEALKGGNYLPLQYQVQMEQQLIVSGAEKCLFMASKWNGNELVDMEHYWYTPNEVMRKKIIAGWAQFEIDLAAYVPAETAPVAAAKAATNLPVVFDMRVEGRLVACNIDAYKPAALAYIDKINVALLTDQDFADADIDAKYCRTSAKKLDLAIEQALGQMGDINTALNSVREIAEAFNRKGLALEKLVKSEKDNRKLVIVTEAKAALTAHIDALNVRLGKPYMPTIQADFAGVIKGLQKIQSTQNAVDTEMARAKIEANAIADKIQANLATLVELGSDYTHLFADTAQIALKAPDDLTALVKSRIADFKASEEKRLESEREKIRIEERAKLDKETADKLEADRVAAEEASMEANMPEPAAPVAVEPAPVPRPSKGYSIPSWTATAIPTSPSPTAYKTRPTDSQLIEVLALHFRVHESKVIEWLLDMNLSEASEAMATSI